MMFDVPITRKVFCVPGIQHRSLTFPREHRTQSFASTSSALSLAEGFPVQCKLCPQVMYSTVMFNRHIASFHPHLLPFKCKICGKGLQTRSGLHLHMATHGERKFLCTVCDCKFKFKHHLQGHMKNVHNLF